MNENIDLTEILKDCPKGTKLYSTVYGVVRLDEIDKDNTFPISLYVNPTFFVSVTSDGRHVEGYDGECTLFPSKDQRDWSKFKAPWYKKEKFDPKNLKPFDRVLGRDCDNRIWKCNLFSHITEQDSFLYKCVGNAYIYCIPYNDDTKHLVGTKNEAPEYYRYWED